MPHVSSNDHWPVTLLRTAADSMSPEDLFRWSVRCLKERTCKNAVIVRACPCRKWQSPGGCLSFARYVDGSDQSLLKLIKVLALGERGCIQTSFLDLVAWLTER